MHNSNVVIKQIGKNYSLGRTAACFLYLRIHFWEKSFTTGKKCKKHLYEWLDSENPSSIPSTYWRKFLWTDYPLTLRRCLVDCIFRSCKSHYYPEDIPPYAPVPRKKAMKRNNIASPTEINAWFSSIATKISV